MTNQQNGYTYLIFDKAIDNDHSFTNKITASISLAELFTSDYACLEGMEAIEEFNKFKELENIPTNLNDKLYKPYLFNYSLKGAKIKIMIVAINNNLLENYVLNKTQIPNKEFFISLCNSDILYSKVSSGSNLYSYGSKKEVETTIDTIINTVRKPNGSIGDPAEEQPSYCTLPLYEYQKKTIRWMKERELNPVQIYYNPNDELIIGNIAYDSGEQNFVPAFDRKKIVFNGGALIDEVGLGKTCQMMVLSLQNQAHNINYIQRGLPMLFSRATLVLCPNHIGSQWCDELVKFAKKEYNLNIVKLFWKPDHDNCSYTDLLDADFVITTFQFIDNKSLQDQFRPKISEMKSYFTSVKSKYSYLDTQTVLDDLGKTTLENSNALFQSNPNLFIIHWHRIVVDEFHEIYTNSKYTHMIRLLPHFKGDHKWCMTGTPFNATTKSLISMFEFVTDHVNEIGDEIILNKNIQSHLTENFFRRNTKLSINSENSTPAPIEHTIFLNFSQTEWMMYNAYLANPNVDKGGVLMRQLCCHPGIADEIKEGLSNCKSLKDMENVMIKHYRAQMTNAENKLKYAEYGLKMLLHKKKIVVYKRQGRFLKKNGYRVQYNFGIESLDKDEIKKLEKYFQGSDDFLSFAFNDIEEDINEDDDNSEDENKPLMIVSDENQTKIQKLLKTEKEYHEKTKAFQNIEETEQNMRIRIEDLRKDYEGKKSTNNYYVDVMERLKKTAEVDGNDEENEDIEDDEKEQCGICLGNVKGTDLGVTKCGHIFCYNCVKPFIHKKPSCPICSKPVKVDELYMITRPAPEEKHSKEFKDKITLINVVGTKLANLMFFLKKNDKHCIIFSQWDELLIKVGLVLDDYGIRNVFCKGNFWQCSKAVKDFNSNPTTKIIMLSSKVANSGLNLQKAEMVIFLDPIAGSYQDRRNMELQAIGRTVRGGQTKQVQIVRFIINNTIEEEIYKENIVENAKHPENVKIFELDEEATQLDEEKINEINNAAKESKPRKVIKKKPTKQQKIQEPDEGLFSDDDDY